MRLATQTGPRTGVGTRVSLASAGITRQLVRGVGQDDDGLPRGAAPRTHAPMKRT
ncbi:hypothetical protein AB0L04_33805 [Streptomyces glaucescens]|uniref:hypothetical protein n=1 Tax=Streptomyces glaucescens TaxID=1907 RepID=UPI0034501DEB